MRVSPMSEIVRFWAVRSLFFFLDVVFVFVFVVFSLSLDFSRSSNTVHRATCNVNRKRSSFFPKCCYFLLPLLLHLRLLLLFAYASAFVFVLLVVN